MDNQGRIYLHFPSEEKCRICGTNEDKECVMVPKADEDRDDVIYRVPVHVDCILNNVQISLYNIIFAVLREEIQP